MQSRRGLVCSFEVVKVGVRNGGKRERQRQTLQQGVDSNEGSGGVRSGAGARGIGGPGAMTAVDGVGEGERQPSMERAGTDGASLPLGNM